MTTPRPAAPIRLHRMALSGHCHRVELFLSLLGLPVELVDVDLAAGAHKSPAFLQLNPFGLVPVIQDGALTLTDSNAILVYLTQRYAPDAELWLPRDPAQAAQVQRWFSVAAGPLAFGAAAARVAVVFRSAAPSDETLDRAHQLLQVMDATLSHTPYLVGQHPTLADIANYSYTAHAPEGRVALANYPHVRAWLNRIEALPGFIPMAASPLAEAA